ncbi:MAG: hypothetical protein ACM3ZF_16510 [Mycobacterium leprae]
MAFAVGLRAATICRYGSDTSRSADYRTVPMPRLFACLLAVAGLLVTVPAPSAIADDEDDCTGSNWRSTLKSAEEWLIKRESSFSPTAANPTSSAFGVGQLIVTNRRHYAPEVGTDPADEGYHSGTTDPCKQLRMMRLYVEDRYGSTKKAKRFWKHHHWY